MCGETARGWHASSSGGWIASVCDDARHTVAAALRQFGSSLAATKQLLAGGGARDDWSAATIGAHVLAKHGYSAGSPHVRWLVHAMAAFERDARRAFLLFLTGSSRLPLGGFAEVLSLIERDDVSRKEWAAQARRNNGLGGLAARADHHRRAARPARRRRRRPHAAVVQYVPQLPQAARVRCRRRSRVVVIRASSSFGRRRRRWFSGRVVLSLWRHVSVKHYATSCCRGLPSSLVASSSPRRRLVVASRRCSRRSWCALRVSRPDRVVVASPTATVGGYGGSRR